MRLYFKLLSHGNLSQLTITDANGRQIARVILTTQDLTTVNPKGIETIARSIAKLLNVSVRNLTINAWSVVK